MLRVSDSILLVGLPGTGKQRFQRALSQACPQLTVERFALESSDDCKKGLLDTAQVWCLIDIRSPLQSQTAEHYLEAVLAQSTAVILTFVAEAELSMQMHWQQWLKEHELKGLPRKRWQGLTVDEALDWRSLSSPVNLTSLRSVCQSEVSLQSHLMTFGALFESKRFHLEHLLMVLDAARTNLAMDLWRVKGCVLTYDYEHPVAIEMTPSRCDVFAADSESDQAFLELLGPQFDQAWLDQAIVACQL